VEDAWPNLRIESVESEEVTERSVGDSVPVRALVRLAGLDPGEVQVQVYHGEVDPEGGLNDGEAIRMDPAEWGNDGAHWYQGAVPCARTGHRGYAVRVLPGHPELLTPFLPGLIRWSSDPVGQGSPQTVTV
jgi:starch phosphorylase